MKYIVLRINVDSGPLKTGKGRIEPLEALDVGIVKLGIEDIASTAYASFLRDPGVSAVAPLMPVKLIVPLAPSATGTDANWGLQAIAADTSPFSGRGARIAVLDTGIDATHAAFAGVELTQVDFTGDGNGDGNGHGTHCAGTILGRDVDGKRVGVARGVQQALIGKVLDSAGQGDSAQLFQALMWAMQNGAHIVSMSLGFDFPGMVARLANQEGWPVDLATSSALEAYRANLRMFDAIMELYNAQAAFGSSPLVVAAAGNESRRDLDASYRLAASLPSAATHVISVAAVGQALDRFSVAPFSNSMATIAAPGVDIRSAQLGGGLAALSGTSMACPHVAGACACALWCEAIQTRGQTPTSLLVQSQLMSTAKPDVFASDTDEQDVGAGLVQCPLA